jgi:hypothetical protein
MLLMAEGMPLVLTASTPKYQVPDGSDVIVVVVAGTLIVTYEVKELLEVP